MSLIRFCGVRSASIYSELGTRAVPGADARPMELLKDLRSTVPVKTHSREHAADPAPAIYIVRDGRDSVVSYAHFLRRAEEVDDSELQETMARVIEGELGFGSWSTHVATWTQRQAPTYLIRFEQLVADPAGVAREAAGELGLPVPPLNGSSRPVDFALLKQRRPLLVRRGVSGSWRDEMSPELEARFWELHGEQMLAVGYERDVA